MSEDKFLHSLREEVPQTFGEDLLAQLKVQDAFHSAAAKPVQVVSPDATRNGSHPAPVRRPFWTIAAASILAVLLGFVIVVTRTPDSGLLQQPDVLSFAQSAPITPQNVNLLQPFASLGAGVASDMALSPDGETLAVATSRGVALHDADDLNAEPTLVDVNGIGVNRVMYRADGLIVGTTYEQRIFIYDPQADELTELFTLPNNTFTVRFNGDGTQLLTMTCAERVEAGEDCPNQWSVAFYDIGLIEQGFRRNFLIFADYPSFAVTDDFTLLAFTQLGATDENTAQILFYDLENDGLVKPVLEIPLGITATDLYLQNVVRSMVFSPDGEDLAISLNTQFVRGLISREGQIGKSIQVWDVEQLLAQAEPQNVSEDAPTTAALDGSIQHGLAFGAEADTLLRLTNEGLIVLDLNTPDEMGDYLHIGSPDMSTTQFSPDGERLYILAYGTSIQAWDWQNQELLQQNTEYNTSNLLDFAFSGDSKRVFSGSQQPFYLDLNFIRSWDLQQDEPQTNVLPTRGDAPVQVAMDDETADTLPGIQLPASMYAVSPDGRYVAYQPFTNFITEDLWLLDRETGEQRNLLSSVNIFLLQFSADGSLFARITNSGIVYRWSPEAVADPDVNATSFTIPSALVNSSTIYPVRDKHEVAPNGQLVAVYECLQIEGQPPSGYYTGDCSREVVGIVHVENRDRFERISIDTEGFGFGSLSFSPDSQTLAFGLCVERDEDGCTAGEVRFHDVRQMTEMQGTLETLDVPVIITIDDLSSLPVEVVFHPTMADDGSQIVAIRLEEGGVQLWHWSSSGDVELLRTLETVENPISFSPDGRFMVTSRRGQVEFWGVPLEAIASR